MLIVAIFHVPLFLSRVLKHSARETPPYFDKHTVRTIVIASCFTSNMFSGFQISSWCYNTILPVFYQNMQTVQYFHSECFRIVNVSLLVGISNQPNQGLCVCDVDQAYLLLVQEYIRVLMLLYLYRLFVLHLIQYINMCHFSLQVIAVMEFPDEKVKNLDFLLLV